MHDLTWIREQPEAFDHGLRSRGLEPMSAQVLALDRDVRAAKSRLQELQARRNEVSKEIGKAKAAKADAEPLLEDVAHLKACLPAAEEAERVAVKVLDDLLSAIPNLPDESVPEGDETANAELRRVGSPRNFAFTPRQHFEIGEALGQMDFERAARLSGARFVVLSQGLARLERALAQFMLDLHTGEHGYVEVSPPLLVRDQTAYGTGNLPKFAEDLFRTTTGYWLTPTAEMTLTNLVADEIRDEEELPLRYTAFTPCFRSEAGAAGKDTRGMIRQHQFYKVELVSITTPEGSATEHERMTTCAEAVLKRLGLPYRVVVLATGDMGFAARKTYDIEVWLPGQGAYREISSCSNCGDFQARRMRARCRAKGQKANRHVHTMNGSGVAIGRALIAVLENYQEIDGSVTVPEVLRPYMGGLDRIGRPG